MRKLTLLAGLFALLFLFINAAQAQSLTINDVSINEGTGVPTNLMFTVTLSPISPQPIQVNYVTSSGSATSPSDFSNVSGTLVFPPNTASMTISVPINSDNLPEPNENFFVNLSPPTAAVILDGQGIGTILNDDALLPPPPFPTLSINDASVIEGNSGTVKVGFTLTLSAPSPNPVTVNFYTSDGSASAASDYAGVPQSAPQMFTFGANMTSATLNIGIQPDLLLESNETFTVTLVSPVNAVLGKSTGIATIVNDDAQPVTMSINDVSFTEGNSGTTPANFTVTLSSPSAQTVTVGFATVDGTANAGLDYSAASGVLTFTPGVTMQFLSVPVSGDQAYENDETFSVVLSAAVNAAIGDGTGAATIVNDDLASPVIFSKPVPDILTDKDYLTCEIGNFEEPSRLHQWKVFYRGAGPITVDLVVAATTVNTAESGAILATLTDETGVKTITVNHPATMTDATGTLSLNLVGGRIYSLTIERVNPSSGPVSHHYKLGSPDRKLEMGWEGPLRYLEGHPQMWSINADAGENVTVEFFTDATAFPPQATGITASLELPSGAALAGPATFTPNGTLTIPGFVGGPVVIRVLADGHFRIRKTSGSDHGIYALPCPDIEKPVDISISDASVTEGNSGTTNLVFAVTIPVATDHTVMVDFSTTNGTATGGSDYLANTGTITFLPGETAKTITIVVNGDLSFEPDETFSVNLSIPRNAMFLDSVGVGTIVNDDALPVLSISKAESVAEGNSGTTPLDFTVTLSAPSPDTISVTRTVFNGTTEFGDIVPTLPIRFSLLPGELTKTITVQVNGDLTYETDEDFTVSLSGVSSGATLGNSVGTGLIMNDDSVPVISIVGNTSLPEGDLAYPNNTSAAHLSLRLSNPSEETIVVNYVMRDVTATNWDATTAPGGDYRGYNGTRTFMPGDTVMVNAYAVAFEGDTNIEPNETFTINLTSVASGTATLGRTQATVTIENDDFVSVGFHSSSTVPVLSLPSEGHSGILNTTFDVELSEISPDTVTVDYTLVDSTATGTAIPGIGDYYKVGGTVTFLPGSAVETITVGVNGDTTYEPDEIFNVVLSNPRNATLATSTGWSSRTSGTIENDDPRPKFALTITRVGIGGVIRTDGVAIDCDGDQCTNEHDEGSTITLVAIPRPGYHFTGWSGASTGINSTVTLTMDAAKSVTATFERNTYTLTAGSSSSAGASGTVTRTPEGIDFGSGPTSSYYEGDVVTVTANPDANSFLTGWDGDVVTLTPPPASVTVTMDADKSVMARFDVGSYTLDIIHAGNGSGTVTSSQGGNEIGPITSATFNSGATITLTAHPAIGSRFAGWTGGSGGDPTNTNPTITILMDAAKSVTAIFESNKYTLSIVIGGPGGTNSVSTSPAPVSGSEYYHGTTVTLTAIPDANSLFSYWGGAASGTSTTATVTMDADKTVTANFVSREYTLNIAHGGNGFGTVTRSDTGVEITSATFVVGERVPLRAIPLPGSRFLGWYLENGETPSSTSETITVLVDAAKNITAKFERNTYTLAAGSSSSAGASGTVTRTPDGIDFGSGPTNSYYEGDVVTVTANPDANSILTRWEGDVVTLAPPPASVTVTMNSDKAVTAIFGRAPSTLTVTRNGTGSGAVVSSPAGIDASTSSAAFEYGSVVTLRATPDANSTFAGWSGDATGPLSTHLMTLDADKSVTATFTKKTEFQLLQSLDQDLNALRNATSNKDDAKALDEAIKSIETALSSSYWFDGTHLQSEQGKKVFDETKNAVNKLRNLLKDKKSLIADATLQGFIDRIIHIDRTLVTTAIDEAVQQGGNLRDVSKAKGELAAGDGDIGKAKYESGLEHFRNAWKNAVAALPQSNSAAVASALEERLTEDESLPTVYRLANAFPNPFNPSTTIQFDLPDAAMVRISVFDMMGREVAMLVDREMDGGRYSVRFDAKGLASGMYLYQIQAGSFRQAKRLLLLK